MLWLALCWLALGAEPKQVSLNVIKDKILAALAELPNYTCTETVDRSRKQASDRKFEPLDRVRLEIAVVGHNELFGWPGSRQITERDVTRMVPGFIGSGDFAMHVRELFVRPEAEFVAAGEEQRGDHRALRYDYRVPVEASGWRLRGRTQDLVAVAYHGSFWVDKDTLDLLEMDVIAHDIPPSLGFSVLSKNLKFTRARISSSSFLLPEQARMVTADLNDDEWLNEARFHDCRQYAVESVIHFDPPAMAEQSGAKAATGGRTILPDDFDVTAMLETAIDSDTAAVGDQVRARVQQPVKVKGSTVIPKNAILVGRISQLAIVKGWRILDMALLGFEIDGAQIDISNRRNDLSFEKRQRPTRQVQSATPDFYRAPFPIRNDGTHLKLAQGSKLFLRSRAIAAPQ